MPLRILSLAIALVCVLAPAAQARRPLPHIHAVACMRSCLDKRTVAPGGLLRITGSGFGRGLRAVFQVNHAGGRRSAATRVTGRGPATATVPARALTGILYVRDRYGRRSNVLRRPLSVRPKPTATPQAPPPSGTAFDGNGMW